MKIKSRIPGIAGLCAIVAVAVFAVACQKKPAETTSAPEAEKAPAAEKTAEP